MIHNNFQSLDRVKQRFLQQELREIEERMTTSHEEFLFYLYSKKGGKKREEVMEKIRKDCIHIFLQKEVTLSPGKWLPEGTYRIDYKNSIFTSSDSDDIITQDLEEAYNTLYLYAYRDSKVVIDGCMKVSVKNCSQAFYLTKNGERIQLGWKITRR